MSRVKKMFVSIRTSSLIDGSNNIPITYSNSMILNLHTITFKLDVLCALKKLISISQFFK